MTKPKITVTHGQPNTFRPFLNTRDMLDRLSAMVLAQDKIWRDNGLEMDHLKRQSNEWRRAIDLLFNEHLVRVTDE